MKPATLVRFLEKVTITDHCWLWTGAAAGGRGGDPYGVFWVPDTMTYAHRTAYEQFVGPIPEGLQIDHLCSVRLCVKPTHLEPVTAEENTRRAIERSGRLTHCPHGHPYDDVNTYVAPNGSRNCRECARRRRKNTRQRQESNA